VNEGAGSVAYKGGGKATNPQPFSFVMAQEAKQHGRDIPDSTAGRPRATISDQKAEAYSLEDAPTGLTGRSEGLSLPGTQESSGTPGLLPDGYLPLDEEKVGLTPTLTVISMNGGNPSQLSFAGGASRGTIEEQGLRPANLELSNPKTFTHIKAEIDFRAMTPRPLSNLNLPGTMSSVEEKVPSSTTISPSPADAPRIGDSIRSVGNSQLTPVSEILSFEGGSRQSQYLLNSYGSSLNPTLGLRASGVEPPAGSSATRLGTLIENGAALQSRSSSLSVSMGDMSAQDFGMGENGSPPKDFASAHQGSSSALHSGGINVFSEGLSDGVDRETLFSVRSVGMGDRSTLPSAILPQRLQMDVMLADDSKVQIEVSVQQRQVSAQVSTDQTLLRNLVLQNEGQLVGQLAEAGLELKQFGAHLFDHPTFRDGEPQDRLQNRYAGKKEQEDGFEHSSRERMGEWLMEPGMHLVV